MIAVATWALASVHGLAALGPFALVLRLVALLTVVVQLMRAGLPAALGLITRPA